MSLLPPDLSAVVSPAECETATAWWDGLTDTDQCEVITLSDPRQDDCFFGIDPEGGEPPTVRGGRFIPHDDAWGYEEWGPDWFDHLMEHPEWVTMWEVAAPRIGHVCTRHPAARAALAAGYIPAGFSCPFASADCPMRRLVSSGQSLRLIGQKRPYGTRRVLALPAV